MFRRGLIEQVDCTLAELGEEREVGCRRCKGRGYSDDCRWCGATGTVREFVPSAWAIAVSTAHPVTRFKITDRDLEDHTPPGVYAWYSREHVRSVAFLESASGPPTIPQVFLDAMNGHKDVLCKPTIAKWFTTRDAAVDALAVVAGALVRQHILKGAKV